MTPSVRSSVDYCILGNSSCKHFSPTCDRSVLGRYLGGMSRRDARHEPDLVTLPERKTEPAPLPIRPVPLPDDLVSCLRQLADVDLERLQSAVVNEVTRRGPPPGVARATEREVRPSAAPRPRNARQFPSLRRSVPENPAPSERPSGQDSSRRLSPVSSAYRSPSSDKSCRARAGRSRAHQTNDTVWINREGPMGDS